MTDGSVQVTGVVHYTGRITVTMKTKLTLKLDQSVIQSTKKNGFPPGRIILSFFRIIGRSAFCII